VPDEIKLVVKLTSIFFVEFNFPLLLFTTGCNLERKTIERACSLKLAERVPSELPYIH
jgi:hypothetical protein